VDDLSNGRLTLGMGAGWQEREHAHFGYDLLELPRRFARFQEGLEVVTRLLRSDEPVSFSGEFYRLQEAVLLPRPRRRGGPPILVGGVGAQRTLPLVARYADEWNAVFISAARFTELNARLDGLVARQGRAPQDVRRSLMTGLVFGLDEDEVKRKLRGRDAAQLKERGVIVGTLAEVKSQLNQLSAVGVQRVMLQWLDLDDVSGLEALARVVL
jgi:alkanesulfonate monooxygenase SsuD/methylene tetrahydromethanopterin reductase-like flavin-dependent oxidoreductase (luciferase family)